MPADLLCKIEIVKGRNICNNVTHQFLMVIIDEGFKLGNVNRNTAHSIDDEVLFFFLLKVCYEC